MELRIVNLLGQLTDYEEAWQLQRTIHEEVVQGGENSLILVEHPPVFTAGKRTQPEDRPWDGSKVIEVDRGGRITWHGPGQLVGYPLIRLPQPVDVMAYVHLLEDSLMATCREFSITTTRVPDRTGVWVPKSDSGDKIAAIGVRVARGVTMHGFALNCSSDLSWFERIVPCGIPDAGVTSISNETGQKVDIDDVLDIVLSDLKPRLLDFAL